MGDRLSCYTAALVHHLGLTGVPDAGERLARAVRLAVRTDLPDGIAFSQHEPVAPLVYQGGTDWPAVRAALAVAIDAHGAVLVTATARRLPWSPHAGVADVPHWLVLHGHGDRWAVADPFDALLPAGRWEPWSGTLADAELRAALTLPAALPPELRLREVHALGRPQPLPAGPYRWLVPGTGPATLGPGRWLTGADALAHLGERLGADPDALTRHADDVWAAGLHVRHRLQVLAATGELAPAAAEEAARGWVALPRVLKFALGSARRGRPRPDLVAPAFAEVIRSAA